MHRQFIKQQVEQAGLLLAALPRPTAALSEAAKVMLTEQATARRIKRDVELIQRRVLTAGVYYSAGLVNGSRAFGRIVAPMDADFITQGDHTRYTKALHQAYTRAGYTVRLDESPEYAARQVAMAAEKAVLRACVGVVPTFDEATAAAAWRGGPKLNAFLEGVAKWLRIDTQAREEYATDARKYLR